MPASWTARVLSFFPTCSCVPFFSILDHFKRRPKDAQRVVGCLLGERVGTTVYVKNCFPELLVRFPLSPFFLSPLSHSALFACTGKHG
jgi:hypothetical protein